MRIKSIIIERVNPQKRTVSVRLSALNVSVIYGGNGCGKTTLLRLISAVLEQKDCVLSDEKIQELCIIYEKDNREEEEVRIVRKAQLSDSVKYDWSALKNSELASMKSILFCTSRENANPINISADFLYRYMVETGHDSYFRTEDDAHKFCENLSKNMKLKQEREGKVSFENQNDFSAPVLTFDTANMHMIENLLLERYHLAQKVAVDRVQKVLFDILVNAGDSPNASKTDADSLKEVLPANRNKLIGILERMEKNVLSDKIISILSYGDLNLTVKELQNNGLLAKLIINMSKELEQEETVLQSINRLRDVFNGYIGPDKYIEITDGSILIKFHASDEAHGITRLSDGEQQLFALLSVFILEAERRNLFMIDEPEASLSIQWQRGLMPLLSTLAPNAQIIVASHSPAVAESNVGFLVDLD